MKLLKLALALTVLLAAVAPNSKAQSKRSSAEVNKAKTPGPVEKDTTAPQYYELRCRGGSALRITTVQGRRTDATGELMANMTVDFIAGTQPADITGKSLVEGQCSWVDRGFRPGEPAQIRQEIIYFGQAKQAQHGTPVDNSPTAAERHPDSLNVPPYLSDPNHYWSFFVRNTGQGYFEATSSRFWKPSKMIPDLRKAGSKSRVGTGAEELNPQPLPPCEKCPEAPKVPIEEKKKPLR